MNSMFFFRPQRFFLLSFFPLFEVAIIYEEIFFKEYREQVGNHPTRVCWKRIIQDLKIYYNFFTDSSFNFKSHVYSDWKNAISLEGLYKDQEIFVTNKISDIEEKIIETEEVNFEKLHAKRKKIYEKLSSSLSNRVGLKMSEKDFNPAQLSFQNNVNYCMVEKSKCTDCNQRPNYTLDMISNMKYSLVIEELKLHNHPSTRRVNKIPRNHAQAKEELKTHYNTRHSN